MSLYLWRLKLGPLMVTGREAWRRLGRWAVWPVLARITDVERLWWWWWAAVHPWRLKPLNTDEKSYNCQHMIIAKHRSTDSEIFIYLVYIFSCFLWLSFVFLFSCSTSLFWWIKIFNILQMWRTEETVSFLEAGHRFYHHVPSVVGFVHFHLQNKLM